MYHLPDEADGDEFVRVESKSDFASYFTLVQENNHNLEFWRDSIFEHKKKIDAQESNLTAGADHKRLQEISNDLCSRESDAEDTDDSHLEELSYEGTVRKKARLMTMRSTSDEGRPQHDHNLHAPSPLTYIQDSRNNMWTPPASVQNCSITSFNGGPNIIKQEPSGDEHQLPVDQVVEIFVGPRNSKFTCSRGHIAQSCVLTSLITSRNGSSHRTFIMDPQLSDITPHHFKAVVEFLHADEYQPLLMNHSDGKFFLDESLGPIAYDDDLVRSAHLLNLAKRFQLPRLADLIFRKVVHGHRRYGTEPFLTFASLMLKYTGADFEEGEKIRGQVEGWIIAFLAENMEQISLGSLKDAKRFWELMKVQGVELKVMEKRGELCKMFPDGRVKIED